MTYFSVSELCYSATARNKSIDNTPSSEIRAKLETLIDELLDPIREYWGQAITVNSGFRCPGLNAVVGGVTTSQHQKGEAADLNAGDPAKNKMLFTKIADLQQAGLIEFDRLIDESHYKWVHVSYRKGNNRNQILHL